MKGDQRQDCLERLTQLTRVSMERYIMSSVAAEQPEFIELGITNAAILCALEDGIHLLTADLDLYLAALSRGHSVQRFVSLR